MEDHYYSKKLDQHFPTRLDVLLYAHDGRGLGHASRTIAIGMALKRLHPGLRILFVTGAKISQSLIGNSNLDWIKLPSYASQIVDGVSTGIDGPANFYKSVLGLHRSAMLKQIVTSFKPKCVLVDHSPLGKRKELLEALEASKDFDTRWILGLRAVIGTQKSFWSDELRDVFNSYYSDIFWYGDSGVLGKDQLKKIESHFSHQPQETGYVSRMHESRQLMPLSAKDITATISIPWMSHDSFHFLQNLKDAFKKFEGEKTWNLFIHQEELERAKNLFLTIPGCKVEPIGEKYLESILSSKMAIIYGGYNSLMDCFAAQIPAIVVKRKLKDQEQDIHMEHLLQQASDSIAMVEETSTSVEDIYNSIKKFSEKDSIDSICVKGSEKTANLIFNRI